MNILVTGAWNCTKEQIDWIAGRGHQVTFLQQEQDALPIPYEEVQGVICNGLFQYHPAEKFTNLRYIQLTSAGFDRVPMDFFLGKGISVQNARDVYSIPMAEFAVCGVLQLYKQSRFFTENQEKGCWKKRRGLMELYGKTVCVIGCGSVGTECAKRFGAFGCRIFGVDANPGENGNYAYMAAPEQLEEILPEADVIVLTLPLTEESRHLINEKRLAHLKPGAVLVNISRGSVVDTQALLRWLQAERGAAVLDVFEEEPLSAASPLWYMENVILTPHNSFEGERNGERLAAVIMSNLRNWMI